MTRTPPHRSIPKHALVAAQQRAADAQDAYSLMIRTHHWSEFRQHWRNFLEAADDVFEKLEKGSKLHPTARQEWKKEENARKADPLMQWLMQARNVEKHGLQTSIVFIPGSIQLRVHPTKPQTITSSTVFEEGLGGGLRTKTFHDISGIDHETAEVVVARGAMIAVTNRSILYDVPKSHLGVTLESDDPKPAAELALKYLDALLRRIQSHDLGRPA